MHLDVPWLRIGLALLGLPAAAFWRFAAWRARLQTWLDNTLARHQPPPPPAP